MAYIVGIDLGGTQIKAAAFSPEGDLLHRETQPTRDGERVEGVPAWADAIGAPARGMVARFGTPDRVGLAAPGMPAADGQSIAFMPLRMEGLEGFDWGEYLGTPDGVTVTNDANAALLGEVWQGAARGRRHVVLLTLGTGVGGAVLTDGRLLRGATGRAGHLGHISLDPRGPVGIMNTPGAIEELIGECSLATRSGGRFRHHARVAGRRRRGRCRRPPRSGHARSARWPAPSRPISTSSIPKW